MNEEKRSPINVLSVFLVNFLLQVPRAVAVDGGVESPLFRGSLQIARLKRRARHCHRSCNAIKAASELCINC